MIGRAIVMGFAVILLIAIGMQSFLLGIPYIKQVEFERICHSYAMKMDRDGGLSISDRFDLQEMLEKKGFEVFHIAAPLETSYNQPMHFQVEAVFMLERVRPDFRKESMPLSLDYQIVILSRKTVSG